MISKSSHYIVRVPPTQYNTAPILACNFDRFMYPLPLKLAQHLKEVRTKPLPNRHHEPVQTFTSHKLLQLVRQLVSTSPHANIHSPIAPHHSVPHMTWIPYTSHASCDQTNLHTVPLFTNSIIPESTHRLAVNQKLCIQSPTFTQSHQAAIHHYTDHFSRIQNTNSLHCIQPTTCAQNI